MRQTTVLIVLLTLTLLNGCSMLCPVEPPKTEIVVPPAVLMQDCQVPEFSATAWGDLPPLVVDLYAKLRECNNDKRLLREWSAKASQNSN